MMKRETLDPVKTLNAEILRITTTIREKFPELTSFIEEMPVTLPDEKHPDISVQNLTSYKNSLNAMLQQYVLEHARHEMGT